MKLIYLVSILFSFSGSLIWSSCYIAEIINNTNHRINVHAYPNCPLPCITSRRSLCDLRAENSVERYSRTIGLGAKTACKISNLEIPILKSTHDSNATHGIYFAFNIIGQKALPSFFSLCQDGGYFTFILHKLPYLERIENGVVIKGNGVKNISVLGKDLMIPGHFGPTHFFSCQDISDESAYRVIINQTAPYSKIYFWWVGRPRMYSQSIEIVIEKMW